MTTFYKYQSLGNHFILFDSLSKKHLQQQTSIFKAFVKKLCDPTRGIGADGVLIIEKIAPTIPHLTIYNLDGSDGNVCLNGLRCAARYLYQNGNRSKTISIMMNDTVYECIVESSGVITRIESHKNVTTDILTLNKKEYKIAHVDVGNPHLLIFGKFDKEWLTKNQREIETSMHYPGGVNISLVEKKTESFFSMITCERGCGFTQSCGSAATALIEFLTYENKIIANQNISISMPGGTLNATYYESTMIVLQAPTSPVFKGTLEPDFHQFLTTADF